MLTQYFNPISKLLMMLKCFESLEHWCYRRILIIACIYHVTNENMFLQVQKEKIILKSIKERKVANFGYITRNDKYRYLHLIN